MDPSGQADRLSDLPNVLLVIIISCLSFKQGVQTSLLSKRWRSLYRETRNVAFKETDFLTPFDYEDTLRCALGRIAFVGYVRLWVARIRDQPIETFGFSVSDPRTYVDDITSLIAFAVQKRVKNLVLDFSHPAWRTYTNITHQDLVIEIPQSVYGLTTLETLNVGACKNFDPSELSTPGKLKSVCFGWMELKKLEPFLKASKKLESLTLENCWGVEFSLITGENMREVVIKNCDFFLKCTFDLPRVDVLKYSGELACFEFDRMNTVISEVELDFRMLDTKIDDELSESIPPEGGMLCQLLNKLLDGGGRTATTLTLCHFLLKMIPRAEHPHLLLPMKTKHLVLMTKLHPKEFNGIRILLMNCPNLEALTLDLLPPNSIVAASPWAGIDPQMYWMQDVSYECLRTTLKTVIVKNFVGGERELHIVRYLMRSGKRLERVELYMQRDLNQDLKMVARARSEMLQRSSNRVQVLVHNS